MARRLAGRERSLSFAKGCNRTPMGTRRARLDPRAQRALDGIGGAAPGSATTCTSQDLPRMTPRQLYFDDLAAGQRFRSRPHTLDATAIIAFARDYDPQPFHIDEAAAKESVFGGLAASGWHTGALTMRLMVESVPFAGGIIGGGGKIEWPAPVRPGDAIEVETEVLEIAPSRTKPDRGSARVRITTRNQRGEVVQQLEVRILAMRRPEASSKTE
jgi:acyl dehydratase